MARNNKHLLDGLSIIYKGFDGKEIPINGFTGNKKFNSTDFRQSIKKAISNDVKVGYSKAKQDAFYKKNSPRITAMSKAMEDMSVDDTSGTRTMSVSSDRTILPVGAKACYRLLAQIFLRLVARTPVDEEYYYTVTEDKVISHEGYETRTSVTAIRKHTLTDKVHGIKPYARDDWKLTISFNPEESKIPFLIYTTQTLKDLGCDLDNEHDSQSVTLIMNQMLKDSKNTVPDNFTFENFNEHFKYIEAGTYNSKGKYASENDPYRHKGAEREHGSHGGFSIQAPRGVARLTALEFTNAMLRAEEFDTAVYARNSIRLGSFKLNKDLGTYDESIDNFIKEHMGKKEVFREQDILNDLVKNKPLIEINDDEEQKEFNDKQHEIFRKEITDFKAWVNSQEDVIERQRLRAERQNQDRISGQRGRPKGRKDSENVHRPDRSVTGSIVTTAGKNAMKWSVKSGGDKNGSPEIFTFDFKWTDGKGEHTKKIECKYENKQLYFRKYDKVLSIRWATAENFIISLLDKRNAYLQKELLERTNQVIKNMNKELEKNL